MTEEPAIVEPTDEELGIFDASPLGQEIAAHYAALKLVDRLKPNKAFAIAKEGFSLKVLRELAEDISTAAKPLVVFEHETVYEVRMLEKGQNPKRFYAYVGKPGEPPQLEADDTKAIVMQAIRDFFERPAEDFAAYEPRFSKQWQDERAFSHTMVSRKIVALSSFRKAKGGGTALLKTVLTELVSEGILYEVPEGFAEQHFGTTGKLYRLLK